MLTSLGIGGAERQVVALAERMAARGHTVSLLVLRSRQPEQWPATVDCVYLDVRERPFSLIAGLARGRRFLRVFKPELIHSHVFPANMAARLLRLFGSAPVLSTVHNVYEGSWPRMLAYRLTDPLSRWTTAVSQAAADRYVRLKAVPARKCSVLTNGIDTAEFAPDLERRARIREEMGTEAISSG
jgi:glycosyltransferase involved in cell wall biosynthesis